MRHQSEPFTRARRQKLHGSAANDGNQNGNQTEPNPIWRPLTSHNIAFHSDSSKKRAGVVCWRPSLAAPLLTTRESIVT